VATFKGMGKRGLRPGRGATRGGWGLLLRESRRVRRGSQFAYPSQYVGAERVYPLFMIIVKFLDLKDIVWLGVRLIVKFL
jgi:hypothetical protein